MSVHHLHLCEGCVCKMLLLCQSRFWILIECFRKTHNFGFPVKDQLYAHSRLDKSACRHQTACLVGWPRYLVVQEWHHVTNESWLNSPCTRILFLHHVLLSKECNLHWHKYQWHCFHSDFWRFSTRSVILANQVASSGANGKTIENPDWEYHSEYRISFHIINSGYHSVDFEDLLKIRP